MTKALAAWLVIAAAAASPSVSAPTEVVQSAVARVVRALETMRQDGGPSGQGAERARAEIRRVASELFDLDEIARRALSRHWSHRTRAEQAEFVALFSELLERAYVGRIEAYPGRASARPGAAGARQPGLPESPAGAATRPPDRITYAGESVDGDYAVVRSRIVTVRGEVALDYRLHLTGARWRVYDLVVGGVSLVSTYRTEFNRIIQSASYEGLVDRLRRRTLVLRDVQE